MGERWYDRELYKHGRLRGYLVGRRESRNLVRFLHKQATGVYDCKQKPCPHTLTLPDEAPPQRGDRWKALKAKQTPAQRTAHKKAQMQRKAERLGTSVTALRTRTASRSA